MKGNFSRFTGHNAKQKHYNKVLKQQGRVQLDADWNELNTIIQHQRRMRTIDTIGQCGAPLHDGGFKIMDDGAGHLLISTGRFYAGGLLCETNPCARLTVTSFVSNSNTLVQVDDLQIDGVPLEKDQWVLISSKEDTEGVVMQIDNISSNNNRIRLRQAVTGFNSPDHSQVYIQVLIPFSDQSYLSEAEANSFDTPQNAGEIELVYLEVWERHITAIEDTLLREVALGGPDTDTRTQIITQVKRLSLANLSPDLSCADNIPQWDTIIAPPDGRLSTSLVPTNQPNDPCQLGESGGYLGLENRLYRVEVHQSGELNNGAAFKWSRSNAAQVYAIDEFVTITTTNSTIKLFNNGKDDVLSLKVGDFVELSDEHTDLNTDHLGVIGVVTEVNGRTVKIGISQNDIDDFQNRDQKPKVRRWDTSTQLPQTVNSITGNSLTLEDGIQLEFSGNNFRAGDYWVFAARTLTGEIELLERAKPHGIERYYCKLALAKWQTNGAVEIEDCRPVFPPLTELPESEGCCCHLTIKPARNWWQVFENLPNGIDLQVCFEPGDYELKSPIKLENLGTIKFFGAGKGSQITVFDHEAAFVFDNCNDIIIRDLTVTSQSVSQAAEEERHLNGVISVYDCHGLVLENVFLSCADSDSQRQEATCVTVRNERLSRTIFYRSRTIERRRAAGSLTATTMTDSGVAALYIPAEATIASAQVGSKKLERVVIKNCDFEVGKFQTGILVVNPNMVQIEGNRLTVRPGQSSVGLQGIVVAGEIAHKVQIANNFVAGMLQGIHLGFSNDKKPDPGNGYFQAGKIIIQGNQVYCSLLAAYHEKEVRHGIFVGNSKDLSVKDNFIQLYRAEGRNKSFAGVHIIGHWGRKMIIRDNHLEGNFKKTGIVVDALPNIPSAPLWIIEQNVAEVQYSDAEIIVRDNV